MLYGLIRPALFNLDPETAHERALRLAVRLGCNRIARESLAAMCCVSDRRLRQTVFGIEFLNPVGLAAGYDKNAIGLQCWPALGFGFVEIGSVTARPQSGHPRPRLVRLPEQRALVNRMGFNNDGADRIAPRIACTIPVGVNVGTNRDTINFAETVRKCSGNFYVINVSSPNTPGLRKLQGREFLREILAGISSDKPVLVKIAPDLSFQEIDEIIALSPAGIVATNTTLTPEGGLSGAPLEARATECIRHIRRQSKLPVIGVGGIFSAADAYRKIRAGASLVEVWTGLVYNGPGLVREINRGLLRLLERDGFGSIAEAVGTE